jgi:hypothetical protein
MEVGDPPTGQSRRLSGNGQYDSVRKPEKFFPIAGLTPFDQLYKIAILIDFYF